MNSSIFGYVASVTPTKERTLSDKTVGRVLSFILAENDKNDAGELVRTHWHLLDCWGVNADRFEKYGIKPGYFIELDARNVTPHAYVDKDTKEPVLFMHGVCIFFNIIYTDEENASLLSRGIKPYKGDPPNPANADPTIIIRHATAEDYEDD